MAKNVQVNERVCEREAGRGRRHPPCPGRRCDGQGNTVDAFSKWTDAAGSHVVLQAAQGFAGQYGASDLVCLYGGGGGHGVRPRAGPPGG